MTRTPQIVSDAIAALRAFGGDLTPEQALGLLSYWVRRREMTAGDVQQVIAHFPDGR